MANAFLQGFTGGMGAMSNVMNYAEQRQLRQQQLQDQQLQRNISTMMHIDNSFGDDQEGRKKYREGMFDALNSNKQIRNALSLEQPGAKISGLEATAAGLVPIISYANPDNPDDQITRPIMFEGSDKPMAISQEDFFRAIGSQPDLLKKATQLEARLLGAGGSLPEKTETSGMGTTSGSKSGSGVNNFGFGKPTTSHTDENGNRIEQYDMPGGKTYQIIRPAKGEPGEFQVYDITNRLNPQNITGQGNNYVDQFMLGNNSDIQTTNTESTINTKPPNAGMETVNTNPKPEEEQPETRPNRVTPNIAAGTGYRQYQIPEAAQQRLTESRSELVKNIADFSARQKKLSNIGAQRRSQARTNYGGMIGNNENNIQVTESQNSNNGEMETIYKEVEKLMQGGDEKALTDYLSQLDDSSVRKVTQMLINREKLVAKG